MGRHDHGMFLMFSAKLFLELLHFEFSICKYEISSKLFIFTGDLHWMKLKPKFILHSPYSCSLVLTNTFFFFNFSTKTTQNSCGFIWIMSFWQEAWSMITVKIFFYTLCLHFCTELIALEETGFCCSLTFQDTKS